MFESCQAEKSVYEKVDMEGLGRDLGKIGKFNEKYELISERVLEMKNINKILYFSKGLEKFKVNIRLLKNMMQDVEGNNNNKMGL